MALRLIEGLHLTATQKRHLAEIIGNGWTRGQSNRIAYTIERIEGEGNRYRYHWIKPDRDDWNRPVIREGRGIVEYLDGTR